MSWVNDWHTWAGLTIYSLAVAGAFYLLGHIVFFFQERARRKRRQRAEQAYRRRITNQEERFRTYMNEKEVGND